MPTPPRSNFGNSQPGSILWAQVFGFAFGFLIATFVMIYANPHPVRIMSISGMFVFGIIAPALSVWSFFGLPIENSGPLAFKFACLVIVMNALEGFIIGTILGWVRKKFRKS